MAKIVPKHIYEAIEFRLHTFEAMKLRISEWQATIQSRRNTLESSPGGRGFYADPTAMAVVKALNPPPKINEYMKWVDLIDKARCFFVERGESKEKLFEVWYGKECSIISAAAKVPCDRATFHRWRNDLVFWIALRAARHMLIKFE